MRLLILLLLFFYSKTLFSLTIDDTVKSTITNNLKVKIAFEKLNESKEAIEVAIGKTSNYNRTIFIHIIIMKQHQQPV